MNTSRRQLLLVLGVVLIAGIACAGNVGSQPPTAAGLPGLPPETSIPTVTPQAAASEPTAASSEPAATQAPAGGDVSVYLDDRSGPDTLMGSFVNAINRHETLRAYSYWEADAEKPPYDQFDQGYADTASVLLTLGTIHGGVAAGNTFYTVPVTMIATTTGGAVQTFVGCYQLHIGSPGAQGALPFVPMGIQKGEVQEVAAGTNTAEQMTHACDSFQGGEGEYNPTVFAADDISPSRYLDDRSDPIQLLRSYFNAINSNEYVRAYSYWEPGGNPQTLEQFQSGYAETHDVELIAGEVTSDAGAGQVVYSMPVTLHAMSGDEAQTFVGCYTFHLSQPSSQAAPPFQGLSIRSGDVQQVANDADTAALMAAACTAP